jgi:hypothetical protein
MACILGCKTTHFEPEQDEQQVDVKIQSVPNSLVIYGQITDCANRNRPVAGAIVKAFKCVNNKLIGICHTFSGCNGFYMLNVPNDLAREKIVIMATCGCVTASFCASCDNECECKSGCK